MVIIYSIVRKELNSNVKNAKHYLLKFLSKLQYKRTIRDYILHCCV